MKILILLGLIILIIVISGCSNKDVIVDDINYMGLEDIDFNIPSPNISIPSTNIENIVVPDYNADEIGKN